MRLESHPAPHIRVARTARSVMWDAITALSFLYAIAFYYHGPRAIVLGLNCALVCFGCDMLCNMACGRKANPRDASAIVTGLILPLMMPGSVPYSVVAIAGAFAILVSKAPFGGTGHNVFNPAAAGFSFVAVCFGDVLFTYPPPSMKLPLWGTATFAATPSPAYTLLLGGTPRYDVIDMALGNYPGPMGATNILVLIACLLYLVFRGTVRWSMPVSFFATVALLAYLFPRGPAVGLASVGYELATGLLLFGGVFLLGDPVTTPKRETARVAFGVFSGVAVMLFRHYGYMEEEITYALLLMNAAAWGFDMAGEHVASLVRRKRADAGTGKDKKI